MSLWPLCESEGILFILFHDMYGGNDEVFHFICTVVTYAKTILFYDISVLRGMNISLVDI